jgi:hypothetical protein
LPEGQRDGSVHRRKRGFDCLSVADGETRGLEVEEFPSTLGGALPIPGEECRKREKKFENAGSDNSRLRCEGIARDQRAIPDVQKRHVPRRVTGGGNSLKRANAIAIQEQARRARFRAGKTNQLFAGFTYVQRKIVREKTAFALANNEFDSRKLLNESVKRPDVIDVRVCQGDTPDRGSKLLSGP